MVKYCLTAASLKFFSSCAPARRVYRHLGNTLGASRRLKSEIPSYYLGRVSRMLAANKKYHFLRNGDRVLEIGTGWIHWEALTMRLFFDIEAILFDIWDNRQFAAVKKFITHLASRLGTEIPVNSEERKRAAAVIDTILGSKSFDDLYSLLGFRYVVNEQGSLADLASESVNVIVSANVLEHVKKQHVPAVVRDFYRLLTPGGYSVHHINFGDHLRAYDQSVSEKHYLRYSDRTWRLLFDNEVQYINRMQRPEWRTAFQSAGFELIDEESCHVDLAALPVSQQYRHYDQTDLSCFTVDVLHRKPERA
jgi:hypothetical protein